MELLLTPEQAAEVLNVNVATVRKWLRQGAMRGVKRRRIWRVPESALSEVPAGDGRRNRPHDNDLRFSEGDSAAEHNRKIRELARAPREVQQAALQAGAEAMAALYADSLANGGELTELTVAFQDEDFHDYTEADFAATNTETR